MSAFGGKADIANRTDMRRHDKNYVLMMGRTGSATKLFQRQSGVRSSAVGQPSYLDRTGKLKALFDCGRPALVDIGGEIDQMNAALGFLT